LDTYTLIIIIIISVIVAAAAAALVVVSVVIAISVREGMFTDVCLLTTSHETD